jgi:putative ABC transport system permease protein
MAVRVSVGADRPRLWRQVLTESILLSAAGSLLGVLLASSGSAALLHLLTSGRLAPGMPEHLQIETRPDAHALIFTAAIAMLTGLCFGLLPAWRACASAPASSLHAIGRTGETRWARWLGKSLVVAQVALSMGLLSAAGLFIRHLSNLERVDLGFRRDHVLLVTLDPARGGYARELWSHASQELLERLAVLPGVRRATLSAGTPLSGAGASRFVNVEGHSERPADRRYISLNWVAPSYFATLGTPLRSGRDFSLLDQGQPRVAIVNEAMAHSYFGGASPIGKHFTFDGESETYEIVGLVGDAHYYEIREARLPTIYLNTFQFPGVSAQFVLRTTVEPTALASAVRGTVRQLLKTVPVKSITTLDDQVNASIVPERMIADLSSVCGGLGALLAAVGLYGLMAYTVARRTREIGIRIALGATAGDTARMVLTDALGMAFVGLLIGIVLAIWAKRLAQSLIPDLPVKSAMPILVGAVAIVAIAVAAAYLPARRAARVDPMEALHYE